MYQVINLCEDSDSDSDDNGERSDTIAASVLPLLVSRKRLRDKEGKSNDALPSNENDPGNTPATGLVDSVVDKVEVSVSAHKRKRRDVVENEQSTKNDAAGRCAQNDAAVEATTKDVGIEVLQVLDHRESHEGITAAAAASYPMNSDSEQTSRDNGSANMHSQKPSTSEPPSNASGRQWKVSAYWKDRLSELADYRKIHGHCNVPARYSENIKLARWVGKQRCQYRLQGEGKTSSMTNFRIQELESLGFEWKPPRVCYTAVWEDRWSELAEYRKISGHCNVPQHYSENTKLGHWVGKQRCQYKLKGDGKTSSMTNFRIQELESLGFEWKPPRVCHTVAWEDRLSELAEYRKIHGHCNVPFHFSENTKLGKWVGTQRTKYKLHREGKISSITPLRIEKLEILGFEWGIHKAVWEDRFSELADYCRIHGHCNDPQRHSKNIRLAKWVEKQRCQYKLKGEGKTSSMTNFRIHALEDLGFKWSVWEDRLSQLADYRKIQGHCNVPYKCSENTKLAHWVTNQRKNYRLHADGKPSPMTLPRIQELESLGFEWKVSTGRRKRKAKKPSLGDDATCIRERAVEVPEHVQTTAQTQKDFSGREIRSSNHVDVAFVPEESEEFDWNGEVHLGYIPGRTEQI
jgi:hypothetical protein